MAESFLNTIPGQIKANLSNQNQTHTKYTAILTRHPPVHSPKHQETTIHKALMQYLNDTNNTTNAHFSHKRLSIKKN